VFGLVTQLLDGVELAVVFETVLHLVFPDLLKTLLEYKLDADVVDLF